MSTAADFSRCGQYRYTLRRRLVDKPGGKTALFVMLNPSTADATRDDPTIRRCKSFALREGCSDLWVVNLFALRSTDPSMLLRHRDPIGYENDGYINDCIYLTQRREGIIVAAWGAGVEMFQFYQRAASLTEKYGHLMSCLGKTKSGQPRHPPYAAWRCATHPVVH